MLFDCVSCDGFIVDYVGVCVILDGWCFCIVDVVVWNLIDVEG